MSEFTTPQPTALIRARSRLHARALNRLTMVFGFWIAVAVLYWPSALGLDGLWRNTSEETYTHGYLILLISLWLVVRERKQLLAAPVKPVPAALLPLLLLSAAWVCAWRATIQELHLMLLPLILLTAIVAALGWRSARVLAFPVGYLYFAMPFWSDFNGIVQGLSAKMTGLLIWITGLPAYMQADYVELPGGAIEIAASCSGLHALIVGLALAALYGQVAGAPPRRRLAWLGVMGILALIVNWVRIFSVIVAAYATDMHSSLVRQHYWLGWWLFALAFAGFLWWTGRRPEARDQERTAEERRQGAEPPPGPGIRIASTVVTLAVLAVLPVVSYGLDWAHAGARTPIDIKWPAAPVGWRRSAPANPGEWNPRFVHPSAAAFRWYTDAGGRSVEVFVVAYRVQTQDTKLLGYWNDLLGGTGRLRPQSEHIVDSPTGRWRETRVVDSAGTRALVWSRYRIGRRLFVEPRLSQLWYGVAALVKPPLSSLTALRAVCTPDCTAARARLASAAAQLQPTLP